MNSTVNENRFQRGEEGQARKVSLGEVEESLSGKMDAKALQEDLESLGFTPSLDKLEMGIDFGRQRARS